MSRSTVVRLDEIQDNETAAGAKASSLARMKRIGLSVPNGFCILSAAYQEHLKSSSLATRIKPMLETLAQAITEERRAALSRLRKEITDAPLSESLCTEIEKHYRDLAAAQLAIRSSATSEDLPGHSFAGQYDTYLGVADLRGCFEAVKKCWASIWTERAYDYRERNKHDHFGVGMAVIVQELVPAQVSGVIFTADPVTGRSDRLIVEACFGLGEALVSGRATPDRFVLAKSNHDILSRSIAEKAAQTATNNTGSIREQTVDSEQSSIPCIADDVVQRLAELAMRAEKAFGFPQDMEWAANGDGIFFLQSRPITTLPGAGSFEDRQVWTNFNAGEVVPDVVTPMTWSMAVPIVYALFNSILHATGLDFGDNPIMGQIAGRAYFNLNTVAGALRRLPGLSEKDVTRVFGGEQGKLAELGHIEIFEEDVPDLDFSLIRMITNLPLFLFRILILPSKRREKFVNDMRKGADALHQMNLGSLSEQDLAARFQNIIDELLGITHIVAFAGLGMLFFGLLEKVCIKWLDDSEGTYANRLLAGMGGIDSAEAGFALWRLAARAHENTAVEEAVLSGLGWEETREKIARIEDGGMFLSSWETFVKEHGHHTRGEIELLNARWCETPDYILDMVCGYMRSLDKINPIENHRNRAEEREKLTEECRRRLRNPIKRVIFNFSLEQAQRGSMIRENMKSAAIKYVTLMRFILLELGERLAGRGALANRDDIFFLKIEEIGPVVNNSADFSVKEGVAARRAEYEKNLTIMPPKVVVGRFDPDSFIPDIIDEKCEVLSGLAISSGVAVGRARVILRATSEERVLPGEILVAPFTDPGWTPYFMTAAAIVVDQGGLLSHGSIIAREYGIPAVVNVGSATTLIKTGQTIRVDGTRGRVNILR